MATATYDTPISCLAFKEASQEQFSKVQFVIIDSEFAGQRIDNFLLGKIKGVPKTYIYRIIRKNDVRANKKRINNTYRIKENDIIRIPPIRVSDSNDSATAPNFWLEKLADCVVYEDSDLLVINKPHGLAVHGGSGIQWGAIELINQIQIEWKHAELIHRIDKETSGILLIAKKRSALRYYHDLLREQHQDMVKTYLMVCHGRWSGSQTTKITAPLLRIQAANGERMVRVDGSGKYAETDFTVEQHLAHGSLMRAVIKTGRTHQIRVHSQHTGHPIIGDTKYAYQENDALVKQLDNKKLNRMMLHAASITLPLRPKPQPNKATKGKKPSKPKPFIKTFHAHVNAEWETMIRRLDK